MSESAMDRDARSPSELRRLSVAMLPELVDDALLATSTAVIIDIFRASTTIVHALANGARAVHPCLTVEAAQSRASQLPSDQRLLGGERGGVRIEGFDLGNSPFEYASDVVKGKEIVFTTTNGTKALNRCRNALRVVIGSFVNISAVAKLLLSAPGDVLLVCAGTDGHMTAEDILFAGALVEELTRSHPRLFQLDICAEISRDFRQQRAKSKETWRSAMQSSRGGSNLVALGYERDIERATTRDLFDVVPVWDQESGTIVVELR